ncbi:MAG: cadherin-like beta sandwich domain-containing protein [Treponema sp.]|jgi:hypothetical protein|nr:cadherin-like beta sandwich domain-containing protein [Treponema sp.]
MKRSVLWAALALAGLLFAVACEQPGGVVPAERDSDATLESLDLSAGSLSPPFDPGVANYAVLVPNRVDTITITGNRKSSKAKLGGDNGVKKDLAVGENEPIRIQVTAEDGKTTETYTVTVTRVNAFTHIIKNAGDLAKIGVEHPLAGDYVLDEDIELENWTPIGTGPENAFSGIFDGKNKTITLKSFADSVFDDRETDHYLGIFGYSKGSEGIFAVIKDVKIRAEFSKEINKKQTYYAGTLIGYADEHTGISGINVEGSFDFSNKNTDDMPKPVYAGGIAGALIASELTASAVSATITVFGPAGNGAYNYVGGLVGIFDRNNVNAQGYIANPGNGPFAGASITHCRSTGNVTGATEGARTNIFAGGIAGGSRYGFKTYYSGKIEDCYATGNVTAKGGGYWSYSGGIAGTITGDGCNDPEAPFVENGTGPTRIVRCYATGVITAESPDGAWPYTGGIVAYNYFGALVSQCWFSGDVVSAGAGTYYDYTGGIAGYNSKQYYGHASRIEDCYATEGATVSGRINGGGIVGQNQVAAIVERCYSRAAIFVNAGADPEGSSSQQGAGGIAGYNAPSPEYMDEPAVIRGCVALNPSLSTNGFAKVFRVVGDGGGPRSILSNNYARADMAIAISGAASTESDAGHDKKDGEDCDPQPGQSLYEELGWDFALVWKMDGGYPVLKWQQ